MPSFREMTLDEIFNGSADFVGLVNIVKAYINALGSVWSFACLCMCAPRRLPNSNAECCRAAVLPCCAGFDQPQLTRIHEYVTLISKRAKGELPTAARWIRDTVTSHPLYKGDGVASNAIIADLLKRCEDIGMGRETCTSLYGDVKMEPIAPELSYEIPLSTVLPTEPPPQEYDKQDEQA